jgi:energy-coupling factor transporter ATP-binding protein EcfA2
MNNIQQINIKNFRNLDDSTFIIKPLTFLLGPNGSGKSTFLKALMFLSKNLKRGENDDDYYYDISNEIKLGGYEDIVTNGEVDRDIEFEFMLNLKKNFTDCQSDLLISVKYIFTGPNSGYKLNCIYEYKDTKLFSDGYRIKGIDGIEFISRAFHKTEIEEFDNTYPATYSEFVLTDTYKDYLERFIESLIKYHSDKDKKSDGIMHLSLSDIFIDENSEDNRILWDNHSIDKKEEYYQQFRTFFLAINYLSEPIIEEFLKIAYLPSIRQQVKNNYLLSNGKFTKEDNTSYYGLLESYEEIMNIKNITFEHKYSVADHYFNIKVVNFCIKYNLDLPYLSGFDILCSDLNKTISNIKGKIDNNSYLSTVVDKWGNALYDISKLDIEEKKNILINMLNSFQEISEQDYNEFYSDINRTKFLKWYLIDNVNDNNSCEKEQEITDFKNMAIFIENLKLIQIDSLSNYCFRKLGFKIAVQIKKEGKSTSFLVHKINLKDNTVVLKPYNAAYESSGFHQIYPIILYIAYITTSLRHRVNNLGDFNKNYRNYTSVYIEQPELHLHPALQTKIPLLFSDFLHFSKIFSDSEDSESNSYLFIETHSEHIIRKIQLMIAKGELSLGDVSINYVNINDGVSDVKELRMAENGNFLDQWPNGFFDEAIELTLELLKAQMNRNN